MIYLWASHVNFAHPLLMLYEAIRTRHLLSQELQQELQEEFITREVKAGIHYEIHPQNSRCCVNIAGWGKPVWLWYR